MVKLADIIQGAGINPENFPKSAQQRVTLYDWKGHEHPMPDVHFVEPIFQNSPESLSRFVSYIKDLEVRFEDPTFSPTIDCRITEATLFVRMIRPDFHYDFFNR